ncbi:hypothetical protein [Roseateles amylovorans]|uniref:Integral membrane protein n=1 Tax=Roseateles amylovorans TaxID=2978473 RepID=A0ABY6AWM7_9BURK|nr:hypothetical protein [Roseateles amylovorans]UXH76174.1 hypothetical protein N4261_13935 [Roseateles amylovorans]
MIWLHALLVICGFGVAMMLRPWRMHLRDGPPWPWLLWCLALPPLWSADRLTEVSLVQPWSGVYLLTLMAGWPLTVLAVLPVTAMAAVLGHLSLEEALQRAVWLGLMPATLTLALGAAVRSLLPQHLMVYILGRGFMSTFLAGVVSGAAALLLTGGSAALSDTDLMLGRGLSAWGEAMLTGMLTAVLVAFRPDWLCTYSDRLYLPR